MGEETNCTYTSGKIILENNIPFSSSSSSSSTGTTARCGLWPVEQDPSIFSYLSPTPSTIVKYIQLFPFFDFRNNKFFLLCGVVSPTPNPNLEDQDIPFCLGHHP
jgi:hypothetical protein